MAYWLLLSGWRFSVRLAWDKSAQGFIDFVEIKRFGVEFAAKPFKHFLIFRVLGITHGLDQTVITPDAAAVLGRTGAFFLDATGNWN